ncbi:aminoglycoside phosphotransferase family protein [Hyphomonas johnsonii]|uniref:Putative phosphotransferase n=1 Tax=Hyphomonas johnsonii MHS-2 TaxID=1280950 RepID=A0A059FEF3_9PROT|nr:aminoglycoside phosphotransferase family protein [Hyphomonas johnsonii]KCZ88898.1 putative phosphotransferase [Hyphomonas johnsonii MHS-2]
MSADAQSSPAADVDITPALVHALIAAQHPDLADRPVRLLDAGWDNVMYRLGDDLLVRLPRRAVADAPLRKEQVWLPHLAPHLPLPVPVPLRIGVAALGYPFTWSIIPWIPGETADITPPDPSEAPVLAAFLKAVHQPAPADAPSNSVRDCPLSGKQEDTERRMAILRQQTGAITPGVERLWQVALATPIDLPRTWIAGDVHARNVLVHDRKLAGFIDWGDMCVADAATDLSSIWGLFDDPSARDAAIAAYGMTPATQARAMGWSVFYGVILLETGRHDTPRHAAMGEAILRRLTHDSARFA